jgi:hypothetical protein
MADRHLFWVVPQSEFRPVRSWCQSVRGFGQSGGCARRVATTVLVVDAEIVLCVLVVILGDDPIITPSRFLRQRKVTLVCLGGTSPDALARAMSAERLILLWPPWLLVGWPVCVKATARPLIGA